MNNVLMEKKNNKLGIILIMFVLLGLAFYAGMNYRGIMKSFSRPEMPASMSMPNVVSIPEPEPEPEPEIVYNFVSVEGEFYAPCDCNSVTELEGGDEAKEFLKGEVLQISELETTTGFYRLSDGTFLAPENVNEGRILKLDTTMYLYEECNVRSGPGTDYKKVGRLEEKGTEIHVIGVDLPTGWWQLEEEQFVGSSNLIESRTTPLDKEMYVVKKANIRKGPSSDYDLVTEYHSGDKVTVVGQDIFTGFYKLKNGNYVGSSNLADKIPTLENSTSNLKTLKYEWTTWYKHKKVKWSIKVDKDLYDYYKGFKRNNSFEHMSDYYSDSANSYYVKLIAEAITNMGKEQKLTKDQIAQEALYFISLIDYKTDKKSRKMDSWSKYVIETLYDDAGDCEDTAILTAAVFMELGYKVALISVPGHAAVGIAGGNFSGTYYELDGLKYFYAETTGEGWAIGQIPDEYKKEKATLYKQN